MNRTSYSENKNTLHRKLKFTMEKPDKNGNLAFLEMNINVNSWKEINCEWYKKPNDTGVVLNFRSCAPIQHKKNIVEGTVHRVFKSTSTWQNFWQNSEGKWEHLAKTSIHWRLDFRIINDALQKTMSEPQLKIVDEKVQQRGQKPSAEDVKLLFFLQYRGNISLQSKQKLEQTCEMTNIFSTRKLRTCLTSKNLVLIATWSLMWSTNSSCCGCDSIYVGKRCRNLTTRISEHQKPIHQWDMQWNAFNYKIIDQCQDTVSRRKPQLNTRDEYKSRERTLKY